ncbi:unnamed protein product [Protopolystoma xenopodis]|uniref:Uncharacterized protein n=1 Tax=Protopolystoma xenopodis TaxID=117903 RepID=A0A448XJW5_9PLAT|nr:unnamed protein product [Protopolystoma xenopodis]
MRVSRLLYDILLWQSLLPRDRRNRSALRRPPSFSSPLLTRCDLFEPEELEQAGQCDIKGLKSPLLSSSAPVRPPAPLARHSDHRHWFFSDLAPLASIYAHPDATRRALELDAATASASALANAYCYNHHKADRYGYQRCRPPTGWPPGAPPLYAGLEGLHNWYQRANRIPYQMDYAPASCSLERLRRRGQECEESGLRDNPRGWRLHLRGSGLHFRPMYYQDSDGETVDDADDEADEEAETEFATAMTGSNEAGEGRSLSDLETGSTFKWPHLDEDCYDEEKYREEVFDHDFSSDEERISESTHFRYWPTEANVSRHRRLSRQRNMRNKGRSRFSRFGINTPDADPNATGRSTCILSI